jgi:hypothetical protein
MNITQAKAALIKLYGKKAAWRYNDRAFKGDEREALHAKLPELSAAYTQAKAAMDARRAELLRDPEYQRLRKETARAEGEHSEALAGALHRRVTVGYMSGVAGLEFFHVTAEGDNWQDAIDKARAKVKA